MSSSQERFPSQSVVEQYMAGAVAGIIVVEGNPPGRIVIDPVRGCLAVRFPAGGSAPDVTGFQNLDLDDVLDDGRMWHQMSVKLDANVPEVYAALKAVIDRVQVKGEPFAQAVDEVMASLSAILSERRGLGHDVQVGLFGELSALMAIMAERGPAAAIEAWRGPLREEHDFGIDGGDLEVKTTLSEKRQHWIGTAMQLVPTSGRPLYLLSIQLTTATGGAGLSLPELVAAIRQKAANTRLAVDARLSQVNYSDADDDLYPTRYALRSMPTFYHVDREFPAVTQARIDATVPSSQRIIELKYRLDLTGWPVSPALFSFDRIPSAAPEHE